MPDIEEAEPATGRTKSLSTAVDEDTYDWFVQHAKDNFRDRSGQLAFILAEYRKRVEADEERASMARGLAAAAVRPVVGRPIRAGEPYTGSAWPTRTVTWEGDGERHQFQPGAGQAAWPDPADEPALAGDPGDDPDEGVS